MKAGSDIAAMRLRAQMLTGAPARSVEHVVDRLLAIQAQDGRGSRLAVRSRSTGLSGLDVERALSKRRTVVVAWLNRGTLHLVSANDYWWLRSLTTLRLTAGNARRLGQEGVSPMLADRGVKVVMDQLAAHGPRTRAELRVALDTAHLACAQVPNKPGVDSAAGATTRDNLSHRGPLGSLFISTVVVPLHLAGT